MIFFGKLKSDKNESGNKFSSARLDLTLENVKLDDEQTLNCLNQKSEKEEIKITVSGLLKK